MEKIKSYRDLKIWRAGIERVKDVYMLVKKYPKDEQYGITAQMKRSALSIPSNIAEGFKRFSHKEYKQFLFIAMGSAAELETQLTISKEVGLITENEEDQMLFKLNSLSKMMQALINKL